MNRWQQNGASSPFQRIHASVRAQGEFDMTGSGADCDDFFDFSAFDGNA
jgi:hypothetical protein